MPFEKVEFSFPNQETEKPNKAEAEGTTVEIETPEAGAPAPKAAKQTVSDVEIEVVDDTPPKDRNRKPSEPPSDVTEDELSEYSDKVRKRIQHFSKGYHDERRRADAAQREREEAVRYAQSLIDENNRLKAASNKQQEALIAQAKARTTVELEQAKRSYREAYESGDSDKVVAAQEALIAAKTRAEKVANWKPTPLQKQETPVQPQLSAPAPDQKAASWQQNNPWFGQDEEMTSLALGLHQKLVREGIDPQSDDYYDRINRRMRQLFPDQFEEEPPAEKPRRASVVAPATRSTAPKKIVLSATAVQLAKRLGLTPEQYARQVAEDMRKQNG
jgi:hypothetical protein